MEFMGLEQTEKAFNDLFTDRETELKEFRKLLAAKAGTALPIRAYRGVTGAGKSFLRRRFEGACQEVPHEVIDCDAEQVRSGGWDPAEIAMRLAAGFGMHCPRTLLASVRLGLLEANSLPDRNRLLRDFASQNSSKFIEASVKSLIEMGVSTSFIGVAGSLVKLGRDLHRISKSAMTRFLKTPVGQSLRANLAGVQQPDEIRRVIFDLFAQDLAEFQPEKRPTDAAVKGAVLVDALEHATMGKDLVADQETATNWIWRLHQACNLRNDGPPMLAILTFGQELPHVPTQRRDQLLTVNLQGFSESDARDYCRKREIEREIVVDQILRDACEDERRTNKSRFHVFSLGLLCDEQALSNDGVLAERETMQGLDRVAALIRRFLKLVDRHGSGDADKMRKLATTPVWDEVAAAFAFAVSGNREDANAKAKWLKAFSFVQPTEGGFTFHAVMRRVLLETASAEDLAHWHGEWAGHWRSRSVDATDELSARAWRHEFALDPQETLDRWNAAVKEARQAFRMAEHAWLVDRADEFLQRPLVGCRTMIPMAAALGLGEFASESVEATVGDLSARLRTSILASQSAIQNCHREVSPDIWATLQNNLGIALRVFGERENDKRALNDAAIHLRLALEVRTRETAPLDWARSQTNLGNVLHVLGERSNNELLLKEAEATYQLALSVLSLDLAPIDWALTQNNLGNILSVLAERDNDSDALFHAIEAYRKALLVRTRELDQAKWAITQNNLGNALRIFGQLKNDEQAIREAVDAFRLALEVRTRETVPYFWAMTICNLGTALFALGQLTNSRQMLLDAADTLRQSFEVYNREETPFDWAGTHLNLGCALQDIGERCRDVRFLHEAISSLRDVLNVFSPETTPGHWAMTQNNLGNALRVLASITKARVYAEEAVGCAWKAFGMFVSGSASLYAQKAFRNVLLCVETCRELGAEIPPEIQEFLDKTEEAKRDQKTKPG